ncbi:hypothetical protein HK100_008675 [Physocladia obscura]|uniref:Probable RNA polymerase II nuclear localization protein SLC7A6OS n=1 Tax=Physocladia obscura TaxID=109957 RepID=A0AAD5T4L1_9FUNG|nr:hypothetical protein HK100_008675 [Physocladia obscura]
MSNVIRLKRKIESVGVGEVVAAVPTTLLISKRSKLNDVNQAAVDAGKTILFKFHHSTGSQPVAVAPSDDPRMQIPHVKRASQSQNQNQTPNRNQSSSGSSSNSTTKTIPQIQQQQIRQHFTVLSHSKMKASDGSRLKILDLAPQSTPPPTDDEVPPVIQQMMKDYELNMQSVKESIDSIDTDPDTGYVYDVYYLEGEVENGVGGTKFFDANGASMEIQLEIEEYGKYFSNGLLVPEESDSEDSNAEGDEDSNAEDDYRNDYPDSDSEQEDSDFEAEVRYVYDEESYDNDFKTPDDATAYHTDFTINPSEFSRFAAGVQEIHHADGRVMNNFVAIDISQALALTPAPPAVLAQGKDFYTAPRFSHNGRFLAWIEWNAVDKAFAARGYNICCPG